MDATGLRQRKGTSATDNEHSQTVRDPPNRDYLARLEKEMSRHGLKTSTTDEAAPIEEVIAPRGQEAAESPVEDVDSVCRTLSPVQSQWYSGFT